MLALAPPAPVLPVWVTLSSQSAGVLPSPVAGKLWASVHSSTAVHAVPLATRVVTFARRFVLQNVGENWPGHVGVSQFWSHGTSGIAVRSHVVPVTHRSAVSNTICAVGPTPLRAP